MRPVHLTEAPPPRYRGPVPGRLATTPTTFQHPRPSGSASPLTRSGKVRTSYRKCSRSLGGVMTQIESSAAVAEARSGEWIVGIDVGGTFTDVIGLNSHTGEMRDGKVLSTVRQEDGVLQSIGAIDLEVRDVAEILHGHTVGINALLSRSGSRTGLIATRGHRDLLDIGRMHREFGDRFYDPT